MNISRRTVLILAIVVGGGAAARGQTFPAESQWTPLPCGGVVMTDGRRDQSGAIDERDIVGDPASPAAFRAFDATFLYLRLRLDGDPAPGGTPRPFSWGFEFDLDGDASTYELLLAVNGGAGEVAIYRNTTTTLPDDPADPADQPALATYAFATNARSLVAASTTGGNADYFLELAVPWSALSSIGLTPTTVIRVWAASSSINTALNGDFACHDGASGVPTLSGVPTTRTAIDPAAAPPGGVPGAADGGIAAGGRVIEGGPGCATAGRAPWTAATTLALCLVVALTCAARRRARLR